MVQQEVQRVGEKKKSQLPKKSEANIRKDLGGVRKERLGDPQIDVPSK